MTIEMEDDQIRRQIDIAYSQLRSQFINISKRYLTPDVINSLKIKYSNKIDSARTYDYINTIEELLRILEKRGILRYDDIEVFKYISSTYVRDNILDQALTRYESRDQPLLPPHNRYLMQAGKYMRNQTNIKSLPEDLAIPETETLMKNVSTSPIEQTYVANYHFGSIKMGRNICLRRVIGLMGTILVATFIILLIIKSNITSVKTPARSTGYEARPGTSGIETTYNRTTPLDGHPFEMKSYTTQPTFQITLLGPVHLSPTNQGETNDRSQDMTKVFIEVSQKIGRNWRDVARYLRVTEYEIDEINSQINLSLNEKALKALLKFQSKCDPLQWKSKLKRALLDARRRDLMELVDELL